MLINKNKRKKLISKLIQPRIQLILKQTHTSSAYSSRQKTMPKGFGIKH